MEVESRFDFIDFNDMTGSVQGGFAFIGRDRRITHGVQDDDGVQCVGFALRSVIKSGSTLGALSRVVNGSKCFMVDWVGARARRPSQ
jgi:hypothetical protein